MNTEPNAAEAAAWNGQRGEDWVQRQATLDKLMGDVQWMLFDAARPEPGEAVLDIGCGGGTTTLESARRVGPAGRVLGVDISAPLVNHAVTRAAAVGLENLSFRQADAQTFPFEGESFDLMISRFGVLFFDDPVAAFRNIGGALRPGGRIAFVGWAGPEANPWFAVPSRVATDVLGPVERSDPTAPGPMAFRDIARVANLLQAAGLCECTGTGTDVVLTPPGSPDEVIEFLVSAGPAAHIIESRGGTDADRRTIAEQCRVAMEAYLIDGRYRVPGRVNLFQARRAH